MGLARIYRLALVLSLAACGGGTPDAAEGDEGLSATSGGDDNAAEGQGGEAELDPCAEGGAPCEGAEATDGAEDDAGTEGEEDAAVATAEGDAGVPVDPEQAWRDKVRLGRQWFMRRCDNCHPGGEEDIGPTLRRIRWAVPRMQRQIRRGSGRMRPIPPGRLSDENMDALMAYMSQFGGVRGVQRPE